MNLVDRCELIDKLFYNLQTVAGKLAKEALVNDFKKNNSELVEDLDYCFEVLAGKHPLGFTYLSYTPPENDKYYNSSIKGFFENFLLKLDSTFDSKCMATIYTPRLCRDFMEQLANRKFRLGFSNRNNMITNLSPMLAKRYPETVHEQYYFIQEKLDGNRCIAYFDNNEKKWKFQSRSGKPLKVNFDMSWAEEDVIFDGEVMTLEHAGTRDFNRTSGSINSKYGDKSGLHYFIYDIIDEERPYSERWVYLKYLLENVDVGPDCSILPVLDEIVVYVNPAYNWRLDDWLDTITAKGGEGIMLRDPNAVYQHKRTDALIKYKKVQTMDLRIVEWNEGKGKYEGAIGSFVCRSDDGSIEVNVAGMPDAMRFSDPAHWMNKIVEIAYFDISQSANKATKSLRFPRLKKIRDDKNETSIY